MRQSPARWIDALAPRAEGGVTAHPLLSRLRELRLEAGISQLELCRRAGFSVRQLIKWEAGAASPNLIYLEAWARQLGVRVRLDEASPR